MWTVMVHSEYTGCPGQTRTPQDRRRLLPRRSCCHRRAEKIRDDHEIPCPHGWKCDSLFHGSLTIRLLLRLRRGCPDLSLLEVGRFP